MAKTSGSVRGVSIRGGKEGADNSYKGEIKKIGSLKEIKDRKLQKDLQQGISKFESRLAVRTMVFKQYLEELRKYDSIYSKATVEELKKGEKISKTLKEFDNPEETLEEKELFLLSQYFAYTNIVDSKEDLEDEYEFDEEDRD